MMNESQTFWGRARTFLVVSLITVMIWLLAESRMIQTQTLETQVGLTADNSPGGVPMVVRQARDQSMIYTLSIQVEGSTAALDQFSRKLQSRIELRVGREIPATPGIHTLELRSLLRKSPDLAISGLTITMVSPETITVEVDQLDTRELPIRVVMPSGIELDGTPRSEPPSVHITAPSSVLSRVHVDEVVLHVDSSMIAPLTQGRLETIPGVPVDLSELDIGGWETTLDPGQVDVLVTIRSRTQKMTIDRIPVQVLLAPGDIGSWHVQINDADKDMVNVEISGPTAGIEQLRSGEIVPKALIVLSFEDLERQIRSKPAQIFGLPPGCKVERPEMIVNLEISRVESTNQTPNEPAAANPGG